MGRNYRKVTTVTRSISFDKDIYELMEERRKQLRMTRSNFVRAILEHTTGVLLHPELFDAKHKAKGT